VRGLVQINNKDINQFAAPGGAQLQGQTASAFPGFTDWAYYATVADDGIYVVYVIEYEGDTRGNEWYANLTCFAADGTTNLAQGTDDQDNT
jgi:hypothetical protein